MEIKFLGKRTWCITLFFYLGRPQQRFSWFPGSGLHGWAFTLKQFAEMYAEKFKIDVVKLMNRLWGESFFNPKTKKWSKQKDDDNKRSFCMYILDPIYKIFDSIMNYRKEEYEALFPKLGINLKHDDKDKDGKQLLKVVMRTWLPAGEALLQVNENL